MKTLITKGTVNIVALLIVGCASAPNPDDHSTYNQTVIPISEAPQTSSDATNQPSPSSQSSREEIIERGSGVFLNESSSSLSNPSDEDANVDIDFEGSELSEFVAIILGDLLGLNYLIDPSVTGTVTLHTSSPVNQADLLSLLEQVLTMNNAALVQNNNLYQVLPAANVGPGLTSPTIASSSNESGYAVQLLPLQYIAAAEMKKLLDPVVADSSAITVDEPRNLIIASGTANELKTIRDTIEIFDVDWLRGMSVGLYPLDNVAPDTLQEELNEILTGSDSSGGLLDGLVRVIPLDRLQSLLVVSSTSSALREVEVWIRRLDQPGEVEGKRLFVYPVQNVKAIELADILGRIFQVSDNRNTSDQSGTDNNVNLAPGLSPVEIGSDSSQNSSSSILSDSGIGLSNLGDIQIIADDVRNALVILSDTQNYQMIESAIRELDVVPLQVMIEASIIEVSLRDDLSYGVEWFFKNGVNSNEFSGFGTLDTGSSGITALAPSFSYTVIDSAAQVRFALNTLASESEINMLSSPSLMVLDNQTAIINVGDEIPVPTRQSISNIDPSSPTVNEIAFRQTGVTLTVTPRVNSSGLVTMEISQEVSTAATTTTSNLDAPTIQNRQIESVVAIHSGETIMLGGLMLEQQANSESGFPLLNKIPFVGNLFSQNTNEQSRTELLVLISPRVVRNQIDARAITDEYRSKLLMLPTSIETSIEPGA